MEEPTLPPFEVTETAIANIESVGGTVRVTLDRGGCCGTTYAFGSGEGDPSDHRFGCHGAWLLVTDEALEVLRGARVDYSDRLAPRRFRVLRNPNTPHRCPCNRSFGAPWPGRGQPDCRARAPMPWGHDG